MFNLFGGKKKDKKEGYFLELNEAEASAPSKKGNVKTAEASAPSKKGNVKTAKPVAEVVPPKPAPVEEAKPVNFATDYLLTQTLSRRFPGHSLDKFKTIAREIKK